MHKLVFNFLKNVDEFNEKLIIFVDGKKLESDQLLIEAGLHEIKVEQYHILNSKYFFLNVFLVIFGLFAHAIESAYLLRRWGRFAISTLVLDVQKDKQIKIRLNRHRKWFLSDRYQLNIQSENVESVDSIEAVNLSTFFGTLLICLIPLAIISCIVALIN